MKQGDRVARINEASSCSWRITAVKSDSRGFWIRLEPENEEPRSASLFAETWHAAKGFVVVENTE